MDETYSFTIAEFMLDIAVRMAHRSACIPGSMQARASKAMISLTGAMHMADKPLSDIFDSNPNWQDSRSEIILQISPRFNIRLSSSRKLRRKVMIARTTVIVSGSPFDCKSYKTCRRPCLQAANFSGSVDGNGLPRSTSRLLSVETMVSSAQQVDKRKDQKTCSNCQTQQDWIDESTAISHMCNLLKLLLYAPGIVMSVRC